METLVTNTPFYLDWNFWTAILAAIAIILSQLPPIWMWFKKAKIDFELHPKIMITHRIGNPNLQLHVFLSNTGARKIKIKKINTHVESDLLKQVTIPSQTYLQNSYDRNSVLFTTFSIDAKGEWSHILNLYNTFNREDEKEFYTMKDKVRIDLEEKLKLQKRAGTEDDLVETDPQNVDSMKAFFNKHFIWNEGEYKLTVEVITDQESANISKSFRFTIFGFHKERLMSILERYKYGEDLVCDSAEKNLAQAILNITEV